MPLEKTTHTITMKVRISDSEGLSFSEKRSDLVHILTVCLYPGTVVCPPGPEVRDFGLLSDHEETYQYLVDGQEQSISLLHGVITTLRSYIHKNGPYDGIIGFAQGAFVASMLVIHLSCSPMPPLKLAIFLSMDRPPFDIPCHLPGFELRSFDGLRDEMSIEIPTAHIWGHNDDPECHSSATQLLDLCERTKRVQYIHVGGREVPRGHWDDIKQMADCIKTTILRAYSDDLVRKESNSPDPSVTVQNASC